ncbi:hypothetical protein M3P05_13725 [Sansalvadorimonas sp. 2012CJ34-2]|uniref:Uncharacterized protein n=1 Tax=Parendozoicomonas callyspongiae TaxID=2942213 RepID=A0ABT0PI17_9GAMM|nr:hypothetical protein [Sansalvadorimonas sp. 2012CJ34-2]MCL6270985.1 hypothetical protein [Sansalvadorimonas sp. 2012CJ34-2]
MKQRKVTLIKQDAFQRLKKLQENFIMYGNTGISGATPIYPPAQPPTLEYTLASKVGPCIKESSAHFVQIATALEVEWLDLSAMGNTGQSQRVLMMIIDRYDKASQKTLPEKINTLIEVYNNYGLGKYAAILDKKFKDILQPSPSHTQPTAQLTGTSASQTPISAASPEEKDREIAVLKQELTQLYSQCSQLKDQLQQERVERRSESLHLKAQIDRLQGQVSAGREKTEEISKGTPAAATSQADGDLQGFHSTGNIETRLFLSFLSQKCSHLVNEVASEFDCTQALTQWLMIQTPSDQYIALMRAIENKHRYPKTHAPGNKGFAMGLIQVFKDMGQEHLIKEMRHRIIDRQKPLSKQ